LPAAFDGHVGMKIWAFLALMAGVMEEAGNTPTPAGAWDDKRRPFLLMLQQQHWPSPLLWTLPPQRLLLLFIDGAKQF